jgi:hypothetical protein
LATRLIVPGQYPDVAKSSDPKAAIVISRALPAGARADALATKISRVSDSRQNRATIAPTSRPIEQTHGSSH